MELNLLAQPEKRKWFRDVSLWVLLFSNLLVILFAIKEHQSISSLMWVYWAQSIIIGFFGIMRILFLKGVVPGQSTVNGIPVNETRISLAIFFLIHYGIFHFGYFLFLKDKSINVDTNFILYVALLFFINHLFSFLYNIKKSNRERRATDLMIYPYLRVVPMHIMIVTGAALINNSGIIIFVLLKTLADIAMHSIEHKLKIGESS